MTVLAETDLENGLDQNLTREKEINLNSVKSTATQEKPKAFQRYKNRDKFTVDSEDIQPNLNPYGSSSDEQLQNQRVGSLPRRDTKKIEIRGGSGGRGKQLDLARSQEVNSSSRLGSKFDIQQQQYGSRNYEQVQARSCGPSESKMSRFSNPVNRRIHESRQTNVPKPEFKNSQQLKETLRLHQEPRLSLNLTDSQVHNSAKKPSKPNPFSKPALVSSKLTDWQQYQEKSKIVIKGDFSSPQNQKKPISSLTPASQTIGSSFQSPLASNLLHTTKTSNNRTTQVVLGQGKGKK